MLNILRSKTLIKGFSLAFAVSLTLPVTLHASYAHATETWGEATVSVEGDTVKIGPGKLGTADERPAVFDYGATAIEFTDAQNTSFPEDAHALFADLYDISEIRNLGKVNTASATNMQNMFSGSSGLQKIDVAGWNTSKVTNMAGMFNGVSVASLDVSKWDTSNVTDMNGMFNGASSLAQLDVSGWKTSNVTNMVHFFDGARKLTSLNVSKWDTSKVTSMGYMFSDAESLESLDTSAWNTSQVTDLEWFLQGAKKLKSIDVSKWDTSKVEKMDHTFDGVASLGALDVSGWKTKSVRDMSSLFEGAAQIEKLDVSKWDVTSVKNMGRMFAQNVKLTSLDLSAWDTTGVINMRSAFTKDNALADLKLAAKTKIVDGAELNTPDTAKSTGKWQLVGAGSAVCPAGDVVGSGADLIKRSQNPNLAEGEYVWQPVTRPSEAECDKYKPKHKVSFVLDGGTPAVEPQQVTVGHHIESVAEPKKEGFVFKGWSKSATDGEKVDFGALVVDSDLTLFAQWEKIKTDASLKSENTGEHKPVNSAADLNKSSEAHTAIKIDKTVYADDEYVKAEISGFAPGSTVTFTVHSTPIKVGEAVVNSDGTAKFEFKIPTGLELGDHELIANESQDSQASVKFKLVKQLADTGSSSDFLYLLGGIVVLSGLASLGLRRRA